jgi:hypothetical protein
MGSIVVTTRHRTNKAAPFSIPNHTNGRAFEGSAIKANIARLRGSIAYNTSLGKTKA